MLIFCPEIVTEKKSSVLRSVSYYIAGFVVWYVKV